ncbi:hypothetical protein LV779_10555 [Streptomyces thinghirensis]|nr:hypothetical protein [Streptomyces thinghirensis]
MALLAGCFSPTTPPTTLAGEQAEAGTVVVGSNNFAEKHPPRRHSRRGARCRGPVTYKHNIGSRETTYGLMKNGSVTVLPEAVTAPPLAYSGPGGGAEVHRGGQHRGQGPARQEAHAAGVVAGREQGLGQRQRRDRREARPHRRVDLADLKDIAPTWNGGSPEFQTRQQGLKGLESVYGPVWSFKAPDAGGPLTQSALTKNTVQAADVFTTDPTIIMRSSSS